MILNSQEEVSQLLNAYLLISSKVSRHFLICADKIGLGIGIAAAVGIAIETFVARPGKPIATAIPMPIPIPTAKR